MKTSDVPYTPSIEDLARTAYYVVAAYWAAQGLVTLYDQAKWAEKVSTCLAYSGESARTIHEDLRAQGRVTVDWRDLGRDSQIEAELVVAVVRGMTGG
jgi:hypothetical protein